MVETPSSLLLPVTGASGASMLKLFKPHSDEKDSAALLSYFGGEGAVRLIEDGGEAILVERADARPSLMAMATSGGDDRAAEILAACAAKLHAPRGRPPPASLFPLRIWFRALFERQAAAPILARCARAARALLASERDIAALHGDLHHDNVLASARGWLAIDPKGVLGERAYEVANLLGNPWPYGEVVHDAGRMLRLARYYADALALDPDRVLGYALAHAGLAACWEMEDGRDPAFRLKCAEILAPLRGGAS